MVDIMGDKPIYVPTKFRNQQFVSRILIIVSVRPPWDWYTVRHHRDTIASFLSKIDSITQHSINDDTGETEWTSFALAPAGVHSTNSHVAVRLESGPLGFIPAI